MWLIRIFFCILLTIVGFILCLVSVHIEDESDLEIFRILCIFKRLETAKLCLIAVGMIMMFISIMIHLHYNDLGNLISDFIETIRLMKEHSSVNN